MRRALQPAVRRASLSLLLVIPAGLAACVTRPGPVATAPAPTPRPQVAAAPAFTGPVLGPDGRCQGPAPATAAAIAPGIGECDLVRLKGKEPTDVLVGESGKGGREVQVLYSEPGGRELYFFVDNKLDRIVK